MRLRHPSCLWALVALVLVEGGNRKKRKGADYYAILGIEESADKEAIKKAYRAKSLEYHPDKCESGKEECQTKFIEVSTAYEVLSDPEKRKVYNEHGEEGLKEGGEGGQSGEQAKQMFRQFFGREPDGNVRIVNRGGQMMFMEEGEPGPKEDIFDDTSVNQLNDDVFKAFITDRDEPWIVNFYKPNDDDSVEAKPEYIKFADTFKDFLKVGAVNCRQQGSTCSKASIKTYPAIRWFPQEKDKDPEVFEGAVTAKLLGKWASAMMPDHVDVIEDKHKLRQWLDNAKGPSVLLFTDKSSTPPMWKALSREFNGRAHLGVVPRCDKAGVFKTPLQREFDVYIPQIVRLDPIDELGKIAEKFGSQIKKDVLSLWLMKLIALGKRAGPAATFKEWTSQRYEAGDCAPTDGQFCFLWLKAGADPATEEATRQLAQKYRTDPIKMMWTNVELNPSILEAFGLENSDATDFFVAFRPKRSRFKVHEGSFQLAELDSFVDGVLNGGPLTGRLKVPKIEL
jgi:DnaJ family protein C protein 16